MNGLDVLIILATGFYAFAVGRNFVFWAFLSIWYSFLILIVLFFLPKKPLKAVKFPQTFINFFGPRYINRTIKKMEKQF